MFLSGKVVEK